MRCLLHSILGITAALAVAGGCVTKPDPTPAPVVPPVVSGGGSGVGGSAAAGSPTTGAIAAGAQEKSAQERDARQATVAASTAPEAASSHGLAKSGSGQAADAAGTSATEVAVKSTGMHGGRTRQRGDARAPHAGDSKSDRSAGAGAAGNANGALAQAVPDGTDDDIVARRLRKAAEQETDPELKDKLWKEYVEYKKNAQVQ